jgi:hypothetical protein
MQMTRTALVGAGISIVATVALAQHEWQAGGMGYFAAGVQMLSLGELPGRLEEVGYGRLSSRAFLLGGGGGGWIGRFYVGGEGYGLLGQTATGSRGEVSLGGGWGTATGGYAVAEWERVRIAVFVGVGGGNISIGLRRPGAGLVFDSLLQEPRGSTRMSTGGWLLQGALGLDIQPLGGWVAGIRLGYLLPVGWEALTVEGEALAGAPVVSPRGISVRLILGGGSFRSSVSGQRGTEHGY